MIRHQQVLILFAALLLAHGGAAQAATETRSSSSFGDFTVSSAAPFSFSFTGVISPVSLDALSGFSFTGGEGGVYSIALTYADTSTFELWVATLDPGTVYDSSTLLPVPALPPGIVTGFSVTTSGSLYETLHVADANSLTFTVADVPEPATMALLGTGLLGLFAARRLRAPAAAL